MLEVNPTKVHRHASGAKRHFIPAGSVAAKLNTSEEPNQSEKQKPTRSSFPLLCKCQGIRVWFPVTKAITHSLSGSFSSQRHFKVNLDVKPHCKAYLHPSPRLFFLTDTVQILRLMYERKVCMRVWAEGRYETFE